MLSAEEAVEKWTESLVKELQQLPQQPVKAKGSDAAKKQVAQERVWGLKVDKKLGDGTVPGIQPATSAAVLGIDAVAPTGSKPIAEAPAVAAEVSIVVDMPGDIGHPPAKMPAALVVKGEEAAEATQPQATHQPTAEMESAGFGKLQQDSQAARSPKAGAPCSQATAGLEQTVEAKESGACHIDAFLEEAACFAASQLATSRADSSKDTANTKAAPMSTIRIPKEWLSRMQGK